jgi:hypothetical protein
MATKKSAKRRCPHCGNWTTKTLGKIRVLTPAGREAISRAARKRWAAYRKALRAQTKKAGARRRVAAR